MGPCQRAASNGVATAALVVGIVSVVLCGVFLPGLVAIGLGIAGMAKAGKLGGAKKGQALAGLILGVLSIAIGVGAWALFVSAADRTGEAIGDAVDEALGSADPDTFEIKIDRCELDRGGAAVAEGTIENTASDTRNFEVEVEFVQQGEVVDTGTKVAFDVAPGDSQSWTIDGFVSTGRSVRCSVVAVNNFLN